jgi:hypothetical protein
MWFSNKKLHEEDTYYIDFIKLKDLKKSFKDIKIWRLNRPVDNLRVETIKNHFILDNVKVVPGQISGWVNEINELEVYDGFHRLCAANDNMYVYIKVLNSKRNEDCIKDFKMINMSVSVPELYLVETTHTKKKVCEGLAQRMCDTFPNCRSASRYPQPQNFNRDNFIELISTLDIDFHIQNLEVKLWNEILGLNKEAKAYVYHHKIKTPKKCEWNNFWLFYLSREFIKSKLEEYFI